MALCISHRVNIINNHVSIFYREQIAEKTSEAESIRRRMTEASSEAARAQQRTTRLHADLARLSQQIESERTQNKLQVCVKTDERL